MITKHSRGQLIFHRGINTHTQVIVDWELIHARRRAQQIKTINVKINHEPIVNTKLEVW